MEADTTMKNHTALICIMFLASTIDCAAILVEKRIPAVDIVIITNSIGMKFSLLSRESS